MSSERMRQRWFRSARGQSGGVTPPWDDRRLHRLRERQGQVDCANDLLMGRGDANSAPEVLYEFLHQGQP